jgi:hypothetical protein
MKREIPGDHGTPMPVKTPVNFRARKDELVNTNKAAMKKLMLVSFVSFFFIIA